MPGSRRRGATAVLGYGLNVGIVGLITLIAIPLMISVGGVQAWAAAAVGQSVGVIATVVIGYGWAISGPAMVAKASPEEYISILQESFQTRLFLVIPTLAVSILVCYFVIPNGANVYSIMGVLSTGLLGLRVNWFLIGLGKPYVMLLTETLPRVAATAVGLGLMASVNDMVVALYGQILGVFLGAAVSSCWALRHVRPYAALPHPPVKGVSKSLLFHRYGISAAAVSAFYSSGPLILLGFTSPASVGTYAVLDRILKQLFTAASPVVDALRGWVPGRNHHELMGRARLALIGSAVAAGLAAIILSVFGVELVSWFSDGQVIPDRLTTVSFGLLFAVSIFSMVLGQVVLISLDLIRNLFYTNLATAAIGLSLAAISSIFWGVPGVFLAIVCGHLFAILSNFVVLRKYKHQQ